MRPGGELSASRPSGIVSGCARLPRFRGWVGLPNANEFNRYAVVATRSRQTRPSRNAFLLPFKIRELSSSFLRPRVWDAFPFLQPFHVRDAAPEACEHTLVTLTNPPRNLCFAQKPNACKRPESRGVWHKILTARNERPRQKNGRPRRPNRRRAGI